MKSLYIAIGNTELERQFIRLFGTLSASDQGKIESKIMAVGDGFLESAYCPFLFYGRFAHELILEPRKLRPFTPKERVGALVSAFMICILAAEGKVPLTDRSLKKHPKRILKKARENGYQGYVSAFLSKLNRLEDEKGPGKEVRELKRDLSSIRKTLRCERNLDRVIRVDTVRSDAIFELEWLSKSVKLERMVCKSRKLRKHLSDLRFGIERLKTQIQSEKVISPEPKKSSIPT